LLTQNTISSNIIYSIVVLSTDVLTVGATIQNSVAILPKLNNTIHPNQGTQTAKGFNTIQTTFPADGRPHVILHFTGDDPSGDGTEDKAIVAATAAVTAAKCNSTIIVSI
jgi:hypothetical protein